MRRIGRETQLPVRYGAIPDTSPKNQLFFLFSLPFRTQQIHRSSLADVITLFLLAQSISPPYQRRDKMSDMRQPPHKTIDMKRRGIVKNEEIRMRD